MGIGEVFSLCKRKLLHAQFPEFEQFLLAEVRESRPVLPKKGFFKFYQWLCDIVTIGRKQYLLAQTRVVKKNGTLQVNPAGSFEIGSEGETTAALFSLLTRSLAEAAGKPMDDPSIVQTGGRTDGASNFIGTLKLTFLMRAHFLTSWILDRPRET